MKKIRGIDVFLYIPIVSCITGCLTCLRAPVNNAKPLTLHPLTDI